MLNGMNFQNVERKMQELNLGSAVLEEEIDMDLKGCYSDKGKSKISFLKRLRCSRGRTDKKTVGKIISRSSGS